MDRGGASGGAGGGLGLGLGLKAAYGFGEFGRASYNTLRMFFYAIFLTDVVRLDPFLASFAALAAILWDAVNDPLVGSASDRIRTRWGRRRPFLLWFSIPFGLAFPLLWWAPPWGSQLAVAVHVLVAFAVADTLQTLVTVPYLALGPELAPGYDQRTSLMGYRMFVNLAASLLAAGLGPTVLDAASAAGLDARGSYLVMGSLFGAAAILPFLLLFAVAREEPAPPPRDERRLPLRAVLSELWANKPFRFAGGVYVLNWISFDLMALMLPYFLLYWLGNGDPGAKVRLFGLSLVPETAAFGILLVVAALTLPAWSAVARRTSKRGAYAAGMSLWIGVQLVVWTIGRGRLQSSLWLAALAGIMTSNAHILPESMFPDAIDWDELRSGERREGLYYGAINFIRKLSSALATFIALQILAWSGYAAPPAGAAAFAQSPGALLAIRLLAGPGVVLLILPALALALLSPIGRERQARIRSLIARRRLRDARARGARARDTRRGAEAVAPEA